MLALPLFILLRTWVGVCSQFMVLIGGFFGVQRVADWMKEED